MDYPPFHFLLSEKAAHRDGQKKNPMSDAVNADKKPAAESAETKAEEAPAPETKVEEPAPAEGTPATAPEAKEESPSAE